MVALFFGLLVLFLFPDTSVVALQVVDSSKEGTFQPDTVKIEYTGRIKTIIEEKCYDCHSEKGEDEEAKEELLWDELPNLDKMDQIYILDAIVESVENGDMPPSKHVFWNPRKKLSEEEATLLIKWAKDLADRLYE